MTHPKGNGSPFPFPCSEKHFINLPSPNFFFFHLSDKPHEASSGKTQLLERMNALNAPIAVRMDNITKTFGSITAHSHASLEVRQGEILALLGENGIAADENRLLTECALFADKIAIDEEIVRLRSHFDAFSDIAALPEPAGRKLDFLIQEINREINTTGSKASDLTIAKQVVQLKAEVEKLREQVQNIE